MKVSHALLSSALALAFSVNALAAPTTDLAVVGSIAPGACTPGFSDGGVIDYGVISAADVLQQANNGFFRFDLQPIEVNILCPAPALVAMKLTDVQLDSIFLAKSYESFQSADVEITNVGWLVGLGRNSNGERIGSSFPSWDVVGFTDRGNSVRLIVRDFLSDPWVDSGDGAATYRNMRLTSFATPGDLLPVAISAVSGRLGFSTNIWADAPINDEVVLDGRALLELVYL